MSPGRGAKATRKSDDSYNAVRLRPANDAEPNPQGAYVLYWMQIYRRLDRNHALNYALACARHFDRPLVVYEGLRLDYPWASRRLHTFVLEGMLDNRRHADKLGLNYWPFVETLTDSGRGLLRKLANDAVLVVTDDYPCFIIPEQTAALATKTATRVVAMDGNSLVPLAKLGEPVYAAAHLRPRIHREFAEAWTHRAGVRQRIAEVAGKHVDPRFAVWQAEDVTEFVRSLPIDASVPPVAGMPGGTTAAKARLKAFVAERLSGYAEKRSPPASPEAGHASGLSPYLHFGHIAIEEVAAAVLGDDWSPDDLDRSHQGKRDGFFAPDADVCSFLDEALTWRDVGLNWHRSRSADTVSLEKALPAWALRTLRKHESDPRDFTYTVEEWEDGATHDDLWNAAQRELVATGTIHNYLRMLWGKKVLEWSASPEVAYRTLVHLNNKYALDGRDPNSYTGILWCFGLFDRPWTPERKVLGTIRYMSSDNTARKFKLAEYRRYVDGLPTIAEVRRPSSSGGY
jgi:deoxyribodipyrimidine photo-lyase